MKDTVKIVKCSDYSLEAVTKAVKEVMDISGDTGKLFKNMKRIAVKVNLLKGAGPGEAVTTHPAVAYAVCRVLAENGIKPLVIDSPGTGTPYTKASLERVYQKCGYTELFRDSKFELNYNTDFTEIKVPQGKKIRQMKIIKPILDVDGVISLAKGKTHAFTQITAAVKNLFGVIPDMYKAIYHAKLKDINNFSDMLVDVCEFIKPVFSIIDAVTVMEGNGPGAGDPRHLGYLIASASPYAVDYAFAEIIGLNLNQNFVFLSAVKRELVDINRIKIKGDFEILKDFKFADTIVTVDGHVNPSFIFKVWYEIYKKVLDVKPRINKECIGCGICVKSCPMQAIELKDKKAVIDYSKCIRCYCCHEMCESRAIDLKKGILPSMMDKFLKR